MCEGQISASLRMYLKIMTNDSIIKMSTVTSLHNIISTDKGAVAQYLEIEDNGPHQSKNYWGSAISNISGVNVD